MWQWPFLCDEKRHAQRPLPKPLTPHFLAAVITLLLWLARDRPPSAPVFPARCPPCTLCRQETGATPHRQSSATKAHILLWGSYWRCAELVQPVPMVLPYQAYTGLMAKCFSLIGKECRAVQKLLSKLATGSLAALAVWHGLDSCLMPIANGLACRGFGWLLLEQYAVIRPVNAACWEPVTSTDDSGEANAWCSWFTASCLSYFFPILVFWSWSVDHVIIVVKGCLVQVGNGIDGLQFEPYWWRPCGVTWDWS